MVEGLHLLPRHRKEIVALLHKHIPGVEVWAYGSRVNGRSHDGSDLDLVLRGPQLAEIDASQLAEITEVLREATVPFLIEARDWARLPKSFHREIEREHVVLVAGSGEAVREEFGIGGERIYCRLEDCMAAIIDYRGKTPRKTSSGIPLITAKVVKGGRIKTPTEFIAIEDYDFWMRRGIPRLGDVLITTEAPLGEVAQLCQQRVALAQRLILLRGKSEVLDNRFLKFLMQSAPVQHQLHARATGTTVLGIKQKELRQIGLALPPLPEQRAIAHILGTLDDKIELNRRMNETLEAMARALFKSWFVDFDPVRAKMAGRNTGLPQDLADLFPARLVESELGEIPEGWEVKVLAECTDLTMGQSPPGSTYNGHGEGLPFFQGRSDFGFRYPSNRRFCTAPNRIAQAGDTLVSVRAPVGDINMAWDRCCIGRGVAALRHKSGSMSFTYYSTRTIQTALGNYEDTGTVFGAVNKSQFEALRVIEPDSSIVDAFDSCARPLDARIKFNSRESLTLTALRDALLPKLISGTLRVKDVETFLDQVL